jgi:hypothetical protein
MPYRTMVKSLSAPHMRRASPNCQKILLDICSHTKTLYMHILASHSSTFSVSCNWSYLYLHQVVPLLEALSDRQYSPEEATATTNLCPLLFLHPSSQTMVTYAESLKRELPSWILSLSISLCKILILFDRLIRWPLIIQSYLYPSRSSKDQHQEASFEFIPSVV